MNSRQYRDFHRGDNEWLSEPNMKADEAEDYAQAWEMLRQENAEAGCADIQVEFTEDIYSDDEYLSTPEWINVTIKDSGVLPFKMARGIIKSKSVDGLRSMEFDSHFEIDVSRDFGGWTYERLSIYEGQVYITFSPKHSNGEIEVNITEQFNQAIGEEA